MPVLCLSLKNRDNKKGDIVGVVSGEEKPIAHVCTKCGTSYTTKSCSGCKAVYSLRYRTKNAEKIKAANAEYYARNKERLNKARRESYESNRTHIRMIAADHYLRNSEKIKAKSREYWIENKEKIKESSRPTHTKWKAANRDKVNTYEHNRSIRARKTGRLSMDIVEKLYKEQEGKCACCGASLENGYHIDHIIPVAKGGMNIDRNIQLLTPRCNLSKGSKMPVAIDYHCMWSDAKGRNPQRRRSRAGA